jgi:L-cysteine S-thiosulfotransferase
MPDSGLRHRQTDETLRARRASTVFVAWVTLLFSSLVSANPINDTRRSSILDASSATQALQADDTQNPAMLWLKDGEALWNKAPGANKKSCRDCHGALTTMRGVAARYPQYSVATMRVLNLGQQINVCRTRFQNEPAWRAEHASLLGLEAAVGMQSRALPIAPPGSLPPSAHLPLAAAQERGAKLFDTRMGQVDLSCRDCHVTLSGKRLGGNVIPQGHPTGYPIYRLEWQSVGSLQRRLRNCMTAVRADVSTFSAQDFIDIEAYLMKRAAGMKIETPAVRP